MRRLALLAILVLLPACSLGGDDGRATIERGELARLVLQPSDLPQPFLRFDHGQQVAADAPGGSRIDPARFGRETGWKARYRRPGTNRTTGPLVVESRVDLFGSSDGAEKELDAARSDFARGAGWQELDEPDLGDDAAALTLVQGIAANRVRYYLLIWRQDNVTSSVLVNGFARGMRLDDALELARAQAAHVAGASES